METLWNLFLAITLVVVLGEIILNGAIALNVETEPVMLLATVLIL
jgi:hypothetical protein